MENEDGEDFLFDKLIQLKKLITQNSSLKELCK
jgi:hypothetical protein